MRPSIKRFQALLSIVALAVLIPASGGQEAGQGSEKVSGADKAMRKLDPEVVRKLIDQLKSPDFRTRDKATQELGRLDEVPDALREATKSNDPEMRRRAQSALSRITDRLEEKAFKALVADLHKIELDRFVRRMATDEKFAGDAQWQLIGTLAKAVTKRATELGGQQFPIPDFDMKSLPLADLAGEGGSYHRMRVLLRRSEPYLTSLGNCVALCTGPTPRMTGLTNSILIVDGHLTGATGVDNSLVIVRGNVGRVTSVQRSIIIAKGNFLGATACDDSFLDVNNQRIRFTRAERSVLVKTLIKTTGDTTSRVLETEKRPVQLLRFSERKTDAQLAWGKEVNGLVVAIAPTERKDKFLVRWKNVGKELLEIPWARFHSDVVDKHADDLLGHVLLKGPEGRVVPARQYQGKAGRQLSPLHSVVLGPGQIHDEIIDPWAYVERAAGPGQYQLWLDVDLSAGRHRLDWEARSWSGKIQSNVLGITVGQ